MDDEFILEQLKKWVPLFYGKGYEDWAFAEKRGFYYYFGYYYGEKECCVSNKLSKPVAIYLVAGLTEALRCKEEIKPIKRRRTK
jgi:hypothetical protein